jgi:hypothetical protein
MLKFKVVPDDNGADIVEYDEFVTVRFTYLPVEVPPLIGLISKTVNPAIVVPPLFFKSIAVQFPAEFLYTLVATNAYCAADGVAWADVNGATQYHTATADITAIAINNTVATTGETPFLIMNTSST